MVFFRILLKSLSTIPALRQGNSLAVACSRHALAAPGHICRKIIQTEAEIDTSSSNSEKSHQFLKSRCHLAKTVNEQSQLQRILLSSDIDSQKSLLHKEVKEMVLKHARGRDNLSFSSFLSICQDACEGSRENGAQLAAYYIKSGYFLRLGNLVYPEGKDLATKIAHELPISKKDVSDRLESKIQEVHELKELKHNLDHIALSGSKRLLWVGLAVCVFQWTLYYHLTFWELSWDVMEPIAYFTSMGIGITSYMYFLTTNEPMEYGNVSQRIGSKRQRELYKLSGFNFQRYQRLQRQIERYRRYLERLK